jgi:hypothetical protein
LLIVLSAVTGVDIEIFVVAALTCALVGYLLGSRFWSYDKQVNELLIEAICENQTLCKDLINEIRELAEEDDLLWHPAIREIVLSNTDDTDEADEEEDEDL